VTSKPGGACNPGAGAAARITEARKSATIS
jgi:hypothetical protein